MPPDHLRAGADLEDSAVELTAAADAERRLLTDWRVHIGSLVRACGWPLALGGRASALKAARHRHHSTSMKEATALNSPILAHQPATVKAIGVPSSVSAASRQPGGP
jgi:hypothetical protein